MIGSDDRPKMYQAPEQKNARLKLAARCKVQGTLNESIHSFNRVRTCFLSVTIPVHFARLPGKFSNRVIYLNRRFLL